MDITPEYLFDPTKKVWNPFGEYKGHDFEERKPSGQDYKKFLFPESITVTDLRNADDDGLKKAVKNAFKEAIKDARRSDNLIKFIDARSYFHNSREVEVLDTKTGKYVKYTGRNYHAQSSLSQQTETPQQGVPEIRDGYYI